MSVKFLIVGCTMFICGMITLCTSYAVDTVLDSMPGVTIVPGGIPLSGVGWVMLLVGGIMIAYNLLKK